MDLETFLGIVGYGLIVWAVLGVIVFVAIIIWWYKKRNKFAEEFDARRKEARERIEGGVRPDGKKFRL